MAKDDAKNAELAALLEEVRALRKDIDVLKANPAVARAASEPSYEVLVKAQRKLPPNYAVLVRSAELPPDYQVLVRAFHPDETVVARVAYPPDYAVAVRQGALPPNYEVAVRGPFKDLEDPLARRQAAKKTVKKSAK
ncbi:MAG TPA: hypothetical protein VH475_19765, partial [Tepidisphaeraceae bacterium]